MYYVSHRVWWLTQLLGGGIHWWCNIPYNIQHHCDRQVTNLHDALTVLVAVFPPAVPADGAVPIADDQLLGHGMMYVEMYVWGLPGMTPLACSLDDPHCEGAVEGAAPRCDTAHALHCTVSPVPNTASVLPMRGDATCPVSVDIDDGHRRIMMEQPLPGCPCGVTQC